MKLTRTLLPVNEPVIFEIGFAFADATVLFSKLALHCNHLAQRLDAELDHLRGFR